MRDLEDGEVLQHAVHHVFLWQVLQLVYEVDEILAHRRSFYSVNKMTAFALRVLRLSAQHTCTNTVLATFITNVTLYDLHPLTTVTMLTAEPSDIYKNPLTANYSLH